MYLCAFSMHDYLSHENNPKQRTSPVHPRCQQEQTGEVDSKLFACKIERLQFPIASTSNGNQWSHKLLHQSIVSSVLVLSVFYVFMHDRQHGL